MNKNRFLYFILALILISSVVLFVYSGMNRNGKGSGSENTAVSEEPEAPATLEEVIEEFNEELAESGETVDPDTFSDYTENYEIEIQEDDVVNIE